MSDDAPEKQVEEGLPAWVMTFADLMSLLMCFFVLLLSFSEMDVAKYKQLAGSMKNAFGVQREIKVKGTPKGINVIAREFSPGRPEPTILNVIRQMTTNDTKVNLDLGKKRRPPEPTPKSKHTPTKDKNSKPHEKVQHKASQDAGLTKSQKKKLAEAKKLAAARMDQKLKLEQKQNDQQQAGKKTAIADEKALVEKIKAEQAAERRKKLEESARLISTALAREIKQGSVDVEAEGKKIIIRVREKASFGSGRAELKDAFRPLLAKVTEIIKGSEGQIVVAGHTDNIPIYTQRFRSNWELSAARAVSVAHEMMLATDMPSNRFLVQGFADTRPMVSNDSTKNRAINRRVEIILLQGEDEESKGKLIQVTPKPEKVKPVRKRLAPVKVKTSGDIVRKAAKAEAAGVRVGGTKKPVKPKGAIKPKKSGSSVGIKIGGS